IDDIFSVLVELRIRNRQETEEIVQDILMVVAEKYRSIKIEISFSSWAYRIMENMLLHYYRKQKSQKVSLTQPIGDLHIQSNNSPDLILMRQLKKCLKQLNSANNRYARIINLKHLGYSTEEMCEKLKISKNNVCVILSRARSLLKQCLEKGDIR
ncbi:MAG: sigma-70 family RNA polymerase sigma factor, partial [candidate division Zixibacteria bacterium]|nr:sigma-70 family RNA polymerase sigma factor [candidate division Zixibacteria bacterium]